MKIQGFSLYLLLIALCLQCAEPNNTDTSTTSPQEETTATDNSTTANDENKGTSSTVDYPQLNLLDLDKMEVIGTYQPQDEEGDCSSSAKKYAYGDQLLVVDHTNCYDYGKSSSYYLLDQQERLTAFQEIDLSNQVNAAGDGIDVVVRETILVFQNEKSYKKERVDTLVNGYPDIPKGAWLEFNERSTTYLFGKALNTSGDWQAEIQSKVKATLNQMEDLPSEVPVQFNGTIGMGTRGDVRNLLSEVLNEVKAARQNGAVPVFSPLSTSEKQLKVAVKNGWENLEDYQKRYSYYKWD